ncbi:MAG TPA: ribonuclease III [Allosphingosinicella sp.]|nr:ribonuclease III [Allosphingosinicella sp.]
MEGGLADWLEEMLGHRPADLALFERALTHASHGEDNYERLEFLGDRVLGLVIAEWLIETWPNEPEGKLSHRLNALVAREVCADVARELDVIPRIRLGRQAIDDGAFQSDNVLGDVIEALIGALYLEAGLEAAARFIRKCWAERIDRLSAPPRHPKALLQEWTAAKKRRPPEYRIVETSGPDHARRFTVSVSVKGVGEATGTGSSKQEAETAAAEALLETLT